MSTPQGYALDWEVSLRPRNTFRVDARAHCLATVHEAAALPALLAEPQVRGLPVLVLGEGSNVLFAAPRFDGLVVHLAGRAVRLAGRSATDATVHVEAAHSWDAFVDWTLDHGLCGLENLALIPGHVGASPIQNIGAYGVEVGEYVAAVHAFDRTTATPVRLSAAECAFGYRDSAFKRDPDRHIVVAVEFRLRRDAPTRLDYAGLREELDAMGAPEQTPRNVAAAVRRIRRRKLPDPAVVGNAGSFFKNPVVPLALACALRERYPAMPWYPAGTDHERKLSAAWLIERAGWRGFREGDAGISAQHALVLVNYGTATGAQLLGVARRVADAVERDFGIRLDPEPRICGAAF
ncbi:MAG TPA: UDP-N-acetylmuramate dehydrogenase [Steroidobacteraceae bacterium]|nr:UDP-N-acetylmuramate dehydrogenase [Steroidobacteraceae bacterium]